MLRLATVRITGNVNPWLSIALGCHCVRLSLRKAVIARHEVPKQPLSLRSRRLKPLEFIQLRFVSTVDFVHSLHSPLATQSAQICLRVAKSFSRSLTMASGVVSAPVREKMASASAARSVSRILGSL